MSNKAISMKKLSWRIIKRNGLVLNACAAVILFASTASLADNVLPTGGSFVSGTGTIGTAGNDMNINQSSTYGITNWNSFSVGSENTVNINNGGGYTMARVTGNTASMINGNLNATGTAYLINQNGVVVGNSGVVTTGGAFVASTRDISDADFNNGGTNTFEGTGNGDVVNNGVINSNGNTILVGRVVTNTGNINSTNGDALLGAGNKVVLSEVNSAGQRLSVEVAGGQIANSGNINALNAELKANGGNIYALAINNEGVIKARGVSNAGGRVVLTADNDITNSGSLLASDTGNNGVVNVTGKNINLENNSTIDTGTNGSASINAANSTLANANWKNNTGTVNFNGDVNLRSDGVNINSGKNANGTRNSLGTNVKLTSADGKMGTVIVNGFENVNLNVDNNSKIVTDGSLIVNAKNITLDEDVETGGDFVLNAAAFDDTTNNFVTQAGFANAALFSDGWKSNHGTIEFAGNGPLDLSICCGVTLTSGLDDNGNRVDLTGNEANFLYNLTTTHTTNDYKWYEAKGFDLFNGVFQGDKLTAASSTSTNGFIILNNNTNVIDFDTQSTYDTTVIANNDTFIDDVTMNAGRDLTIVVDEATPLAPGAGRLVVDRGAELTGQTIGIYTSRQANNEINGTLNGVSFTEGQEFVATAQEKWGVFFSTRTSPDLNQSPFKVYYKNNGSPFTGTLDCSTDPSQAGCSQGAAIEPGKEYRVALGQDTTTPEEGALAWGNSSQVRANEFYTVKSHDYVDTNLTTSEKLTTFWYALPLQLVNIPLSGLTNVPGLQGIAEGLKGVTGGLQSGLDSVVR